MDNQQPQPASQQYVALARAAQEYMRLRGSLTDIGQMVGDDAYFDSTYIPSDFLFELIEEYEKIATSSNYNKQITNRNKGILLEQIVNEVFECLQISPFIEFYASISEQLDTVLSGEDQLLWDYFCLRLGVDSRNNRKIIAEAKNWGQKVDAKTVRSFAYIIQHKYKRHCSLGIIFAQKGATGFDEKYPKLRDARAVQIIFHASSSKYIVIFNHDDILSLVRSGEFIRRLKAKIEDVEDIVSEHREADIIDGKIHKTPIKPDYLKQKIITTKLPK